MTGWPLPPAPTAHVQAAALRAAFPQYVVNVITRWDGKPRLEVVSRDGGDPYCLISDDAREIWHALPQRVTAKPRAGGCPAARAGQRRCRAPGHGADRRRRVWPGTCPVTP